MQFIFVKPFVLFMSNSSTKKIILSIVTYALFVDDKGLFKEKK